MYGVTECLILEERFENEVKKCQQNRLIVLRNGVRLFLLKSAKNVKTLNQIYVSIIEKFHVNK